MFTKKQELTNRQMRKLVGIPDMSDMQIKINQKRRSLKNKIADYAYVAAILLDSFR